MRTSLLCCLLPGVLFSLLAGAVDLKEIERALGSTGVEGWVHGSVPTQNLYVFTYRNPDDFFDHIEMSLVSNDAGMTRQLEALNRHDKVRIKGKFLDNPSPQKHIELSSLELVKKYENPYASDPYSHEAKLPEDLLGKDHALFVVHAIGGEGHILVLEYKDVVVPVYVKNAALVNDLFRNDLVELHFRIQKHPDEPVHLRLDESQPVKVVESIRAKHGKPAVVTGFLVLFPKSPEIKFNVFAVLEDLPEGLKRQYTLVNFESSEEFAKIRELLQKAWDKFPGAYVNGRNKLVSTRIRVMATGVFNEVDANQANPQILIKSVDALKILDP